MDTTPPRTPEKNPATIPYNNGHIKITRLKTPEESKYLSIFKDLTSIPQVPEELKLTEPDNWATWSSVMMAIADLSGFNTALLEDNPVAAHICCKHHNLKSAAERREGKLLGLLIKYNISPRMNDLVSLTTDGYEAWTVLKLYCARYGDVAPARGLRTDGGCIRIS